MKLDSDLLGFPFRGEGWARKFLIGSLLGYASFVIWPLLPVLSGAGVRVMRQTLSGEAPTLPGWDDLRDLLRDGGELSYVVLLYSWPVWAMLFGGVIVWALGLDALVPEASLFGREFVTGPQAIRVGLLLFGAGSIVILVGLLVFPLTFFPAQVAHTHALAQGELRRARDYRAVWRLMRSRLGPFVVAYVVWFGLVFVMAGVLLPVAGPVVYYATVLAGAMYGQIYHDLTADSPG